jgi:hypothetical protein
MVLSEEFRLAVHQLGEVGFKAFRDLRVQLPPRSTKQCAMRCILHQCVLEQERCLW